jgi:hypothetical protein
VCGRAGSHVDVTATKHHAISFEQPQRESGALHCKEETNLSWYAKASDASSANKSTFFFFVAIAASMSSLCHFHSSTHHKQLFKKLSNIFVIFPRRIHATWLLSRVQGME